MSKLQALTGINQRVWYIEGGVHPTRSPSLLALGKFGSDPAQTIGAAKKITAPDPNSFNGDIEVGTVDAATERATLGIEIRSTVQASILIGWKNKKCRVDIFALSGRCGNPQDFTEGGEKWVYFPDGRITNHGYVGFGAMGLDENKETDEKVEMTSEEYYEFLYMNQQRIGASVTIRQVYTVDVYTGNDCENCPDPCDRVLATMAGVGATPGTLPVLLYSKDGGILFSQQTITTLFSNEDVADATPLGGDFVLISNSANSISWTDIELLLTGATNTWQEVVSGFVNNKGPRAMSAADVRHLWIVGDGGYIYFCQNYKVGVVVQDAGVATTQNLLAVHAYDTENVLAVGNSNAVIHTSNGGDSWEVITGPAVGINLSACWMWDPTTWFVGEGNGGTGKLWLTIDSGKSWTQVGLPGGTYVKIDKIKFISEAEGYLSARGGGGSFILRTITAGAEWVVLPQGKSGVAVPNSQLNDIAVCSKYSNTAFAAGIDKAGTGGIIVKMSA